MSNGKTVITHSLVRLIKKHALHKYALHKVGQYFP